MNLLAGFASDEVVRLFHGLDSQSNESPGKLAVLGCWLLFGTLLLTLLLAVPEGGIAAIGISIPVMVLYAFLLYRITSNYWRKRKFRQTTH